MLLIRVINVHDLKLASHGLGRAPKALSKPHIHLGLDSGHPADSHKVRNLRNYLLGLVKLAPGNGLNARTGGGKDRGIRRYRAAELIYLSRGIHYLD